ncbi:MAG: hypothetical protein ACLQDQ_10685 [Myxococcaceae bacterium]
MASEAPKVRNARYRPFRAVALGAYLVVVLTFSTLVIVSVVRSVMEMTPHQPLNAPERLSTAECARRAQQLYEQLETRRQGLSAVQPAAEASLRWTAFRVAWVNGLRQARASCAEDSQRRDVFQRLETLENLYTTSAVQYSGEMGPAVDAFRRALGRLRDGGS